jgi:hypothetical protein
VNGVDAGTTDVDRVMTGDAPFADRAALAERERIVAVADHDFSMARDIDVVVTVAGDNRSVTKNGDVGFAATRNTDGGAHLLISPLNSNAFWRKYLIIQSPRKLLITSCQNILATRCEELYQSDNSVTIYI